jgi:hypothetical protein
MSNSKPTRPEVQPPKLSKEAFNKQVGKKVAKLAGIRLKPEEVNEMAKYAQLVMDSRVKQRSRLRDAERSAKRQVHCAGEHSFLASYAGIGALTDAVEDLRASSVSSLTAAMASMREELQQLRATADNLSARAETNVSTISQILTSAIAKVTSIANDFKEMAIFVLGVFGGLLVLYWWGAEVYAKLEAMLGPIVAMLGSGLTLGGLGVFWTVWNFNHMVHASADDSAWFGFASTVTRFIGGCAVESSKKLAELGAAGGKMMKGVTFFSWAWNIFQKFLAWFGDSNANLRDILNNSALKTDVADWMEAVRIIAHDGSICRMGLDLELAARVSKLSSQGHELNARLARIGDTDMAKSISHGFRTSLVTMAALNDTAQRALANADARPEPLTIMWSGPPGIGKTTMSHYLCLDMMNIVQPGVTHTQSEHIYARTVNDEFYAGYHGQAVFMMDDVFQFTKGKTVEKTLEEIIALVNTAPYRPPMASIEEKNSTVFISKMVVMSTNMRKDPADGKPNCIDGVIKPKMEDSGAFWRRMHLFIEPVVKDEYRPDALKHQNVLDNEKAAAAPRSGDCYYFNVRRAKGVQSVTYQNLDYDDLIRLALERMAENFAEYKRVVRCAPDVHPPLRLIKAESVPVFAAATNIPATAELPHHNDYRVWSYQMMASGWKATPQLHAMLLTEAPALPLNPRDQQWKDLVEGFTMQMRGGIAIGANLINQAYNRTIDDLKGVTNNTRVLLGSMMLNPLRVLAWTPWDTVSLYAKRFALLAAAVAGVTCFVALAAPFVKSACKKVRQWLTGSSRVNYEDARYDCGRDCPLDVYEFGTDEEFVQLMSGTWELHECVYDRREVEEFIRNVRDDRLWREHTAGMSVQYFCSENSEPEVEERAHRRNKRKNRSNGGGTGNAGRPEQRTPRAYRAAYDGVPKELFNLGQKAGDIEAAACHIVLEYRFISAGKDYTSPSLTYGLMSGNRCYTVRHLFNGMQGRKGVPQLLTAMTTRGAVTLNPDRAHEIPNTDFMYVEHDGPLWPDLSYRFATVDDYDRMKCRGMRFQVLNVVRLDDKIVPHTEEFFASHAGYARSDAVSEFYIHGRGKTWVGASGSILVADTPAGVKIFGWLSLTGNESSTPREDAMTFSTVTVEELQDFVPFSPKDSPPLVEAEVLVDNAPVSVYAAADWQKIHPRGEANAAAWRSRYPDSDPYPISIGDNVYREHTSELVMTGMFPDPELEPARLEGPPGDRDRYYIEPATKMSKACAINTWSSAWKSGFNAVTESLLEVMQVQTRVQTRTAVWGNPRKKYMGGLKMTTSAGWPYRKEEYAGARTKREIFGTTPRSTWCPHFSNRLTTLTSNILDAQETINETDVATAVSLGAFDFVQHDHAFIDTLKDELRPRGKAPRLFQVANVEMNILAKMLYGEMISDIYEGYARIPIKVGINPYNDVAWSRLAKWLGMRPSVHTPKYIAGDFSGFDKMLSEPLLDAVFDIMDILCTTTPKVHLDDEHPMEILDRIYAFGAETAARMAVRRWIIHSRHISKGFSYTTHHGNPSGNCLTTTINSIAQWLLMEYAMRSMVGLHCEDTPMAIYGDDSVIRSPDLNKVTQQTLTAFFLEHNIVFTNASKDVDVGNTPPLLPYDGVEFLKRSFYFVAGRWKAPLRLSTIMGIPAWTSIKNLRNVDVANGLIAESLREMSAHGLPAFDSWQKELLEAIQRVIAYHPSYGFCRLRVISLEEADRMWLFQAARPNYYIM